MQTLAASAWQPTPPARGEPYSESDKPPDVALDTWARVLSFRDVRWGLEEVADIAWACAGCLGAWLDHLEVEDAAVGRREQFRTANHRPINRRSPYIILQVA